MSVLQVIGVLRTPSVLINAVQKGIHSAKYTTRRRVQYNTVCSSRIQCNSTLYSAVHCLGLAAAISPNPILGLIPRMSPLQALHLTLLNASYLMITSKCLKIKIPSVMEVAPRYTLFLLFTLVLLFKLNCQGKSSKKRTIYGQAGRKRFPPPPLTDSFL